MYMLLNMTTGRMYMLFNFSGVEIATGCIGVYFFMLILPLDAFIEIATGRISFNHFRDCIDIATGRL